MKAVIVCSFFALVALASAEPPSRYLPPNGGYQAPSTAYGAPNGYQGNGNNDDLSEPANYEFRYEVKDEFGNDFGHSESRQGDVAKGRYYVLLPDGRTQIVEYTADENGYNPEIRYEESQAGGYNGAGNRNGGYNGGADGYRY